MPDADVVLHGKPNFCCEQLLYVAVNPSTGSVYVADSSNNRVQVFDANGNFITKWGTAGSGDGQFNIPENIAVTSPWEMYT